MNQKAFLPMSMPGLLLVMGMLGSAPAVLAANTAPVAAPDVVEAHARQAVRIMYNHYSPVSRYVSRDRIDNSTFELRSSGVDFKQLLVESGLASPRELRGCSAREIRKVEKAAPGSLPEIYKQFLAVAGRGAGRFWQGSDAFFPEILELPEYPVELSAEEGKPISLPSDAFVFMGHQGYQFYYFQIGDGVDPPIYHYMEGTTEPVLVSRRFSEFISGEIQKEADLADRLRRRQGNNLGCR